MNVACMYIIHPTTSYLFDGVQSHVYKTLIQRTRCTGRFRNDVVRDTGKDSLCKH